MSLIDCEVVMYMCCSRWFFFFFFKQKTAYEMRISDWSSDVCSSDLGFNMLVGVAVGFIALAGAAAETGVVVLNYLEQAMAELKASASWRVGSSAVPTCSGRSCWVPSSGCDQR